MTTCEYRTNSSKGKSPKAMPLDPNPGCHVNSRDDLPRDVPEENGMLHSLAWRCFLSLKTPNGTFGFFSSKAPEQVPAWVPSVHLHCSSYERYRSPKTNLGYLMQNGFHYGPAHGQLGRGDYVLVQRRQRSSRPERYLKSSPL